MSFPFSERKNRNVKKNVNKHRFPKNRTEKQHNTQKNQTETPKCHRKYVKFAQKSDRKLYLVK